MHGDLLNYIKADMGGETEITWDLIANLPEDLVSTLVEVLPRVLDDQCSSFIYPLAAVDFSYSQYGGVTKHPVIF